MFSYGFIFVCDWHGNLFKCKFYFVYWRNIVSQDEIKISGRLLLGKMMKPFPKTKILKLVMDREIRIGCVDSEMPTWHSWKQHEKLRNLRCLVACEVSDRSWRDRYCWRAWKGMNCHVGYVLRGSTLYKRNSSPVWWVAKGNLHLPHVLEEYHFAQRLCFHHHHHGPFSQEESCWGVEKHSFFSV